MEQWTPKAFLTQCEGSSHDTYELFKNLIETAKDQQGRAEIRRKLTQLIQFCGESDLNTEEFISKYHFHFDTLALSNNTGNETKLTLLQLPSIFTPEDWSFTFFEGLARYPSTEFQGRHVAELGCGNGWISIAMGKKCSPAKIFGLDINPRAITCARINLLINALDDSGELIVDFEGKSLIDRVEFHQSDLLAYIIENNLNLDRIIGCIPQVLSPEPLVAAKFVSEDADDSFLYSLSNYCEKQGYIEDQFGLGLIARALEEAISVAKPSAKVILNLGGRPGKSVLERLFLRRGFSIKKLWSTKVWQAADTDILPLVEIERMTPHRFEFFTSLTSDEPICAKTAHTYSKSGGRIAHGLSVYEAQIKHPTQIKALFNLIRSQGFEDSRNGLDLAFENEDMAEEKINFIGSIAEWLQQKPNLPYSDAEGEPQLRRQIAQFLRSYWKIPLTAKSVLVAPNRRSILKNKIHLLRPEMVLIEKELTTILPGHLQGAPTPHPGMTTIIEAPKRVDEICKLVELLRPALVVTALQDFEAKTSDAFVRLIDSCAKNNALLILDLSQQFELSSQPNPNGVLSYLSEHPMPSHVSILIGLVRNKVYTDLELSILLSENFELLENLTSAAELTYSRPPLLTQRYYGRIFADLLNFQLTELRKTGPENLRLPAATSGKPLTTHPLSKEVSTAFQHPAIASLNLPINSDTVRMDYGENALNAPPQLYSAIMESFLRQNVSFQDLNCEKSILEFVQSRFGFDKVEEKNVLLGNGVAPVFCAFLESINSRDERLCLPTGAYGYFKAACDYVGTRHEVLKTSEKRGFKISATELDSMLTSTKCQWLYLNAPIVNPTGAVYTNGEIMDLLDVLRKHDCGLIMDTIFSGLEFKENASNLKLSRFATNNSAIKRDVRIIILGGLSKELAAGGLRFGWALTDDEELLQNMKSRIPEQPHSTVRHAARKIYLALTDPQSPIQQHLSNQRKILHNRSEKLSSVLTELGWDVLESEGGLFVCASPTKYLNFSKNQPKHQQVNGSTAAADQVTREIFSTCNLLLNDATWTGLPSHLRFVLSVENDVFERGLEKLREFDSRWQSENQ